MAATVWRGSINFGLISIPVRLFRAARAERIPLRRLYREKPPSSPPGISGESIGTKIASISRHSESLKKHPDLAAQEENEPALTPVRQASVREGAQKILPEGSVTKGYEYEKGRYVAIEPEELKNIAPKTTAEMAIQEFVELATIDPVFFETSYYVTPEEAGERAYALLYRALQNTGLVAIAQFAMHSREHVVVLRPGQRGIVAHTMYYASEVRAEEEYPADVNGITQKELELAQKLIQSLAASFEPGKYRDLYRERLQSIIAGKTEGKATRTSEPVKQTKVLDITEALRKSLANLKKPATSDRQLRNSKNAVSMSKKTRGAS